MFDQTEDSETFPTFQQLIQTKITKLQNGLQKCLRQAKKLNLNTYKIQLIVFLKQKLRLEDIVKISGQQIHELELYIEAQKDQFMMSSSLNQADSHQQTQRAQQDISSMINTQSMHGIPGLKQMEQKMKSLIEIQAQLVRIDTSLSIKDARQFFLTKKWIKTFG